MTQVRQIAAVVGRTRVGISVGHYPVGDVSPNGSQMRGAGELLSPALVVPIAVTLHPYAPESTVGPTRLAAALTFTRPAGVPIVLGHAEHEWLGGQDGPRQRRSSGPGSNRVPTRASIALRTASPLKLRIDLCVGSRIIDRPAWTGSSRST